MIGFFVFEETPTLEKPLSLAHSALKTEIKGLFYVRSLDCKDIGGVQKGAEFFGVLDDASGFGACLFVKDIQVEENTLLLQNSLHVKKNTVVEGSSEVKGSLKVGGQITGKSTVTKMIFTADDIAILAAQITTMPGPMAAATLNHVTVEMQNG